MMLVATTFDPSNHKEGGLIEPISFEVEILVPNEVLSVVFAWIMHSTI